MGSKLKLLAPLFAIASFMGNKVSASDEFFIVSRESYDKIHSSEFVNVKKTFAEAPPLFKNKGDFNIPQTIAFEDSREKINLAPGDIIKISEDLTFSDWGGNSVSTEVAAEDFVLSSDKIKKTEEEGTTKKKNINFSSQK